MSRMSITICLGLFLTLSACGDDGNAGTCEVPEADPCECTGLPAGFAICSPDTSEWAECECPPAPTNGPPVTVGSLMWQTTLGPSLEPSAAVTYCDDYEESGHSDWRLPSQTEFETFFSECAEVAGGFIRCEGQCNDSSFCTSAAATWYRTSTVAGSGKHYIVHTGNAFLMPIDDSFSVSTICVRDAP